MELIQTTMLSDSQKKDILALEAVCQQQDKLQGNIFLSNSINFNSEINCFFMLYDENILISFLAMFIPTLKEAEVSAYTLPERRRQGHFGELLNKADEELKAYSIKSILFVHEPDSNVAKLVLERINAKYEYSEYLLSYKRTSNPINQSGQITLELCSNESIEEIITLNMDIFKDNYEDTYSMVDKTLKSKDLLSYIAYLDGEMIGVCNVNLESEDVSIFGLGISSCHQGKGYAKEMLSLLLDRIENMNTKSISLEVNSVNDSAYNLYRKSGFEIKTQFDYYRYLLG